MEVDVANKCQILGVDSNFLKLQRLSHDFKEYLPASHQAINCDPHTIAQEFYELSESSKIKYVENFETFLSIVKERAVRDSSFDRLLVWSMIKRLRLRPPSQLFNHVELDDYVEIYDRSGIQVFRNLKFCLLISYSIHEILIRPWSQLYARHVEHSKQIESAFGKVFLHTQVITDLNIDEHLAWQSGSEEERVFRVKMKYFSPLFSEDGRVNYMLAGSTIEKLLSRLR